MEIILAAFVMLHTLDSREAAVNTEQITSVVTGRDGEGNKLLTANVHCVIGLTNGKFISVIEECDEVLRKIKQER